MTRTFWKMHGAGNDFILLDDRERTFPTGDTAWIRALCTRRTGIGSDGLLLIQPSGHADIRMRFFDPDGSEGAMCGNGARCLARLAHELGAAPTSMRMETGAGPLSARRYGEDVLLVMMPPTDWRMHRRLEIPSGFLDYHFVNSGIPHAVVPVDDANCTEVARLGPLVRHHPDFRPRGACADFISMRSSGQLFVRTFESGVEAETPACGTGIVASALIAARLGWIRSPARVFCAGGEELIVTFDRPDEHARHVTLRGPTRHVFSGTLPSSGL